MSKQSVKCNLTMQVEGVRMTSLQFIVLAILVGSGQGQECQDVAPFGNFFIQQGSSFCVNCPLTGSSIQWLIDNVPVNTSSPPLDHSIFSNNSLIMRSSKTGPYRCVNSALTTHQFTVVLAMDEPPFITDPTVYNETNNVRLICRSNATPSPITSWRRNGVTVGSFALLEIDSIQRSGAGTYACCAFRVVAGNSLMTCRNFTIIVQYPPTISSSPDANSVAAVNTDHMIQCGFEGVPTPTVVWTRDGNILTNGSNNITIAIGDSSSTLTISTLAANDAGRYTCMVSNILGTGMASSALLVQFPPDPPSAVMVTATTTAQISLSWTNPSDGNSPITMVTVAYQQTGGQNSTDTATRFTSHTITGLMPNMEYTIFIESFNDIGGSGSVSMTGTTRPLPPTAPNVTLTPMSSTVIRVNWTPGPTDASMTAITRWTVRYYPTGDSSDVMEGLHGANDDEYLLTGLSKGTSYTVSVAATNSAGMGPFAEQTVPTPADPPSMPTNLTATALSHSVVRVTWGPVSDDGGAVLQFYRLVVIGPDLSSITDRQFTPDTTEDTIMGLVNNTNYRIYLSATNSRGFGPNATFNVTTLDIGVPQPPDLMESDISAASVTVTWNVLSDVEIDHYLIQYRVIIGNPEWIVVTVPSSLNSNSYAITGLSPRTTYEVRIFAVSTDGVTSVATNPITITTEMQSPVMIRGDTAILFGETLQLECLLSDGSSIPFRPQWSKDSGSLPGNATLEGTRSHILMIRSVISSDAGLYICTNEEYSEGGPATANVTISNGVATAANTGLDTMEYVLIGIGGAILLGILILVMCIICVCCVRYRRRPKIYSPSKGSNWIDGDGHTGIVFMASSYSSAQSPSQREETTDAPYLGCKEDDFQNASTFNTLERSAIHGYHHSDSQGSLQDNNSTDKSHRPHYAELDLAPSSKHVPASTNSVHYAQVDKTSFKRKRSLSPPRTKAVPVPVEIPTAAAVKKQYDNPTYGMSTSYHYPVTPGDTVV